MLMERALVLCVVRRSRITEEGRAARAGATNVASRAIHEFSCWFRTQKPGPMTSLSQARPVRNANSQGRDHAHTIDSHWQGHHKNSAESWCAISPIGRRMISSIDIVG